MKRLTIELTNGRLLFFDKVKSYDLKYIGGGRLGVFEIQKEGDGSAVFINWDHLLFASCKEEEEDASKGTD